MTSPARQRVFLRERSGSVINLVPVESVRSGILQPRFALPVLSSSGGAGALTRSVAPGLGSFFAAGWVP
jgi:hypothetical protein